MPLVVGRYGIAIGSGMSGSKTGEHTCALVDTTEHRDKIILLNMGIWFAIRCRPDAEPAQTIPNIFSACRTP
jgi:hypothetical protein